MGYANQSTAGHVSRATATSTARLAPYREALPAVAPDFAGFAATLLGDLDPRSALERVLVDRLTLAAWRLHLTSLDEFGSARDGDGLAPVSRETLRAERSLESALDLL